MTVVDSSLPLNDSACFICEDKDTIRDSQTTLDFHCPSCTAPPVSFNKPQKLLNHIAAHVLYDPRANRAQEPCGMCLSPAPLCHFRIKISTGSKDGVTIDYKHSS